MSIRKTLPGLLLICVIGITTDAGVVSRAQAPDTKAGAEAKILEARKLLLEARANALKIKNSFQRDLALEAIGVAQARSGDLEAAVDTAIQGKYPLSVTLDEISSQLARTDDLARALALGKQLKEESKFAILANLVEAQIKQRKVEAALISANLIKKPEVRSYALESIALLQAASGNIDEARKTFARARADLAVGLVKPEEFEMAIVISRVSTFSDSRAMLDGLKPEERFSMMIGRAEQLRLENKPNEARVWFESAVKELPAGEEFLRYFAIPTEVKLGQKDSAIRAAETFKSEMRMKGYMAVAVTCAETKDLACVETAVEKMRRLAASDKEDSISDFGLKLMTLNVTAALIASEELDAAKRFLNDFDEQSDDASFEMGIQPELQLQRVLIWSLEGRFDEARSLALKMRSNSITDVDRGNALRITALLQTKARGKDLPLRWASGLVDIEDRAYALIGIAQALLDMDETRLSYGAIQIH